MSRGLKLQFSVPLETPTADQANLEILNFFIQFEVVLEGCIFFSIEMIFNYGGGDVMKNETSK